MRSSSPERQRRKLRFAVIAVAVMVSTLLGFLLFAMGRMHPRF